MSDIKDGGPAFPVDRAILNGQVLIAAGMSLRDYFAAKAMSAMLAGHFSHYGHENYWPRPEVASEAYGLADAMLAAREKGGA